MAKKLPQFTVIRDSSEKVGHGWTWNKSSHCNGTIIQSMNTADYTIGGLEDIFIIERKKTVSELYKNLMTKDYKRFKDELIRMKDFPHAYIVCEFDLPTLFGFPFNVPYIPKNKKYKIKSGTILYERITKLYIDYNIQIIFAGRSAKDVVSTLFKRMVTLYPNKIQ